MTTDHVYVGVNTWYSGKGKSVLPADLVGKIPTGHYLTGSQIGADAWVQAVANGLQPSAANGQLKPGHFYALAYVEAYSATAIAIRFRHADFDGCTPGGMCGTTVYHKKNLLDFSRHGTLPVFSSSSPLDIDIICDTGTETPVIKVGLYDLGESAAGITGIEDFNLWEEDVTDGAGLTELDIVALSTDVIRDGFGTAYLVAAFCTGTAPLRAQLGSTDPVMQPVNIEIEALTTLASDFQSEQVFARPELMPNSKIYAYASS